MQVDETGGGGGGGGGGGNSGVMDSRCQDELGEGGVTGSTSEFEGDQRGIEHNDWLDLAKWPTVKSSLFIDAVVTIGPAKIEDMEFPPDEQKRHFSLSFTERKLDNGEKLKRRWLVYSKSEDKAFCFCCKLFRPASSHLSTCGTNDWNHFFDTLKLHEKSAAHLQAYCEWTETESRLKLNKGVDADHQRIIKKETKHWRDVLERLLEITLFLAEHNLAFRGSSDKLFTPDNGIFLGLVELVGKFDNVLGEHLRRVLSQQISDHYCSKTIQNELLDLLAENVLEKIVTRLKAEKYFSLILDCTPDISHTEKMTFIIRFVDTHSGSVEVKKHFLCFKTVKQSTGEELFDVLLRTLEEIGIDFKDCRGQGYDNGPNMTGRNKGVQARGLELNLRASFMPCGCHSVNLVLSDAASSTTSSIHLFGVLQRIYVLFSASVQRWKILTDNVPGLTVKELSTTRWESHIDSVKAIRYQTKEVHAALIELSECSNADAGIRHEATTLANQLTDYKFLLCLAVWYDLLFQVNIVSKAMQSRTMDMAKATSLFRSCLENVEEYRNSGYEGATMVAKEIAESMGADVTFKDAPRKQAKKRLFDYEGKDEPAGSAEEMFKRDFFLPLIDVARVSLEERFTHLETHNGLWGFLYDFKTLPNPDILGACCTKLHHALTDNDHFDICATELRDELQHLSKILPPSDKADPRSILQFLKDTETLDVFPNVWVALRILLTLPVSVASAERSFSKLKLIKTYLRSTMNNDRLNSLAVLSIENDVAKEIDFSEVTNNFAAAKARKGPF